MKKVMITAPSRQALLDLLREHPLDLDCGGPKLMSDGTISVVAYVAGDMQRRLNRNGCTCHELYEMDKISKERQSEVGVNDRYNGGRIVPHGTGIKK